jgi:1-phosphofructokinase
MATDVVVFAPRPVLTVTIEQRGGTPDVHLHAGGQGVWQARMLATLDVPVILCACLGGETGGVLRHLLDEPGIRLRIIDGTSANGAYVHDRRDGQRREIAETAGTELTRHEMDELYQVTLAEGLSSGLCLLSGAADAALVPPAVYQRIAHDLSANGCRVLADLTGQHLDAVLAGGAYLVKISHEELLADGRATSDAVSDLLAAMAELAEAGPEAVIVTRAADPALVQIEGEAYELRTPDLEPADPRGAGDSLTAAVAAGLARGLDLPAAVRLGGAAGALNVTRHGLGSGNGYAVERLVGRIELKPLRQEVAS